MASQILDRRFAGLAQVSQSALPMSMPSYSLAALGRRVTFQPHEAIAVAQSLIDGRPLAPPEAPYGPPSLDTVEVREDGLAACIRSDARPAVAEIALLLESML